MDCLAECKEVPESVSQLVQDENREIIMWTEDLKNTLKIPEVFSALSFLKEETVFYSLQIIFYSLTSCLTWHIINWVNPEWMTQRHVRPFLPIWPFHSSSSTLWRLSITLRIAEVLPKTYKEAPWPDHCYLLDLLPTTHARTHRQLCWAPGSSPNTPRPLPSQGFCIHCSIHLKCSSLDIKIGHSLHFIQNSPHQRCLLQEPKEHCRSIPFSCFFCNLFTLPSI